MIVLPKKNKKKKSPINRIATAAITSMALVADVAYGAGNGSVSSTIEINDLTTNGPVLSNGDFFGSSVANIGDLNGDGVTDLLVGAPNNATNWSGTGAAHILFMNTDGSVDSTVEINGATPNGPVLSGAPEDALGSSVAGIGDLNGDGVVDLVIGARNDYGNYFCLEDDGYGNCVDGFNVDNAGSIHILFMNTDGSVDSTVAVNRNTPNGPTLAEEDDFGSSVANIGDLNGDGVTDLAVGAPSRDGDYICTEYSPYDPYNESYCVNGYTQIDYGAVHILFMNTDGSVDATVVIDKDTVNGPSLGTSDLFGSSVANIGDLNGDGVTDLAVGAKLDDAGGANRGAVHILFMNTNGSVDSTVEINDLTTNGPVLSNADQFGSSVANIGDLNGDGVTDLAVGAVADDAGGSNRGAVHILFMNTDGSVDSTVEINSATPNGPTLSDVDYFGASVANIGDLNGDGVTDLAVGADRDDAGGSNRGAVHILFMYGTSDNTSAGASGGGAKSYLATSCTTSAQTVKVGEEVGFDVDIKTTEKTYDFTWTKELTGSDTTTKYTFNEPGTFYPRGQVRTISLGTETVNCGTVVVEASNQSSSGGGSSSNRGTSASPDLAAFVNEHRDALLRLQQAGIPLSTEMQELLAKSVDNTNTFVFTQDLTLDATGAEVSALQQFLIAQGYAIPAGITGYFGVQTQNALAAFQQANNITPAVGYFGPKTRAVVNGL